MADSELTDPSVTVAELPKAREWGARRRRRRAGRSGMIAGAVILLIFVVGAILASLFHDGAYLSQPRLAFIPPAWQSGGSSSHLLGTDDIGRDVVARSLYGVRISLIIGIASVTVATIVGLLIGVAAGYLGGWVDNVLMRITDGVMAVPVILLAISIIGAVGASATTLVFVLAGSQWMSFARVARSETLGLRQRQFITAEVALGAGSGRIVLKHMVPHVIPNMIVLATLSLPNVILLAAGLDFLGLGTQPPTPSIGGLISGGLQYLTNAPWLALYPGLVLMVMVVGINLLGDGLSEELER